ncbi:hypothetical protein F5146DRAFT_1175170 [Armillaria mellea]|nr:hypothetical protein F5146DRAFT_1175170 [Armillaria mellea]
MIESSSSSTFTNGEQYCVINFARLIGVIVGVCAYRTVTEGRPRNPNAFFSRRNCPYLRHRDVSTETTLEKCPGNPISIGSLATRDTVHSCSRSSPSTRSSTGSTGFYTANATNVSNPSLGVQSNNPFYKYPFTETVSPHASSEAPPATSQTYNPYDSHGVARYQQAATQAKYSGLS